MTRPDLTDDQLTRRLGDALKAEARQHPLPDDFAASVSETLPDRTPRSWWSLTAVPAAAATVVVAVAAVALVVAISPRLIGPAPGSSPAPSDHGPRKTPDPAAVIECQLPDSCEEMANAASPLLPGGESNWVIIAGRSRGQLHGEVHACYPSGDYYLVDVFDFGDGPTASLRASGWPDPPCRTGSTPSPSPTPEPMPSPTAVPTGYFVRWQNDDDASYHVELIEDGPPDDPVGAIFHPWIIGSGEAGVVEIPSIWAGELQVRLTSCDAVAQWVVEPGNYEVIIHGGQATLNSDAAHSTLVPMPTASTCIFSGP
jgi:hypothetical protein